jgi:hypothetical protein
MQKAIGGNFAYTSHPKNGRGLRTDYKDEKDPEMTLNRDNHLALRRF